MRATLASSTVTPVRTLLRLAVSRPVPRRNVSFHPVAAPGPLTPHTTAVPIPTVPPTAGSALATSAPTDIPVDGNQRCLYSKCLGLGWDVGAVKTWRIVR